MKALPSETDHLKVNYGILKKEKTRRITLAAMPGRARIWEIPVMQYLEDHGNAVMVTDYLGTD